MEHCFYCNDEGRTKEDPYRCSYCGREYNKIHKILTNSDSLFIPSWSTNTDWEENFINTNTSNEPNPQIKKRNEMWAKSLLQLLENLRRNKLKASECYYIYAPPKSDVDKWSYEMLKTASELGYKTSSVLDITDINEYYKEITEDYLLIIRISDYKLKENIQKLNYIIPKRKSLDLVTILTSTLPYSYASTNIVYPAFENPLILEKI